MSIGDVVEGAPTLNTLLPEIGWESAEITRHATT
jgi:hypothetical protein